LEEHPDGLGLQVALEAEAVWLGVDERLPLTPQRLEVLFGPAEFGVSTV
jgi:hypothetical protein